jgi:hypothetical protein
MLLISRSNENRGEYCDDSNGPWLCENAAATPGPILRTTPATTISHSSAEIGVAGFVSRAGAIAMKESRGSVGIFCVADIAAFCASRRQRKS